MEVNGVTSNIAFSVKYGNEPGLWVIGMDGKDLHRPFPLVWNEKERWEPLHPSWSPDGKKMVYEEDDSTAPTSFVTRLVIYDFQKRERQQLTNGPRDQHPVWSSCGDWIAYTHHLRYDHTYAVRRIWLIRPDGSEQKPVVDEKGKMICGWWPAWNPEGTEISCTDAGGLRFLSFAPAKAKWSKDPLPILGERSPYTFMAHHWGKHGWLISTGGVRLLYADSNSARMLAETGTYKSTDPHGEEARWGSRPYDIPAHAPR